MTSRRAGTTVGLALGLSAAPASAQPAPPPVVTLAGCAFAPAALERALAHERVTAATIDVRCDADGLAHLTLATAATSRTREVDLRDVPPALAPRVLALVATVLAAEPPAPPADPAPPVPPPGRPPPPPSSPEPSPEAPLVGGPGGRAPIALDAAPARGSLWERAGWRAAVIGRGFVRDYGGTSLWGAGAGVAVGPVTATVQAAATSIDHRLGTVTPWTLGIEVGAVIACNHGYPITCVGARAEVARQAVAARSDDPAVMATSIATAAVHGAGELSFTLPIAGVDVTASAALGAGTGLVARANSIELVRLAGWTVGGAVEVRP